MESRYYDISIEFYVADKWQNGADDMDLRTLGDRRKGDRRHRDRRMLERRIRGRRGAEKDFICIISL